MSKPSVAEIIKALGGQQKVAELCECSQPTVSGWLKDEKFPRLVRLFLGAKHPELFAAKARARRSRETV